MVFKDPEADKYKRSVVKVAWNVPEEKEEQNRIAVAYKLDKNQEIPPNYLPPALVWDIEKPNEPINRVAKFRWCKLLGCIFPGQMVGIPSIVTGPDSESY
jgi:hypothetical protein